MPIIAGRASAAYGAGFSRVVGTPYAGPYGAFDSLATISLASATTSVTFSGIPSGYKHLQIRFTAKSTAAGDSEPPFARFNGDTSSNYAYHNFIGNGSSIIPQESASTTGMYIGRVPASNFADTYTGASIIDIADYASDSKYKVTKTFAGFDGNGSGGIYLLSGLWMNTAPITSITIYNTGNFIIGSQFALYGVK